MKFQRGNAQSPPPARGRVARKIQAEYDWARMSQSYQPPAAAREIEITPELRKAAALYTISVRGATDGERTAGAEGLARMIRRHMLDMSDIQAIAESEARNV